MLKKPYTYLIAMAAGIVLRLIGTFLYIFILGCVGYLLIVFGLALSIYAQRKNGNGFLFLGGLSLIGIGLLSDLLSSFMWFLPYGVVMLLYGSGCALLVLRHLYPERDIRLREVENIRHNGNKLSAAGSGAVIFFGFALFVYAIREALAILTLAGFALIGYGVYRLVLCLTQPDLQKDSAYREQDEALGSEIRRLQRIMRGIRIASVISCAAEIIAFFVMAVTQSFIPLVLCSIACAAVLGVKTHYRGKLKEYVADNIVKQALQDVFEVEEYRPFGCIERDRIVGKYFGIGDFDSCSGSDYVRGFYKGLPIEMCDMKLIKHEVSTDDDGREVEYDVTVFRGFWLICDFEKELSAEVRIWERDGLRRWIGGKGIAVENEQFTRRFRVESAVEVEAFYILTPHMMEYILEMDQKARGKTHMRFERGGKVQIAIDSGRDAFEVGKRIGNATLLRRQFVNEIRYITDLIDELRLVDTLYKQ